MLIYIGGTFFFYYHLKALANQNYYIYKQLASHSYTNNKLHILKLVLVQLKQLHIYMYQGFS